MNSLLNDLISISVDLRSGKVATRNKAAEQLDRLLKDSKNEVIVLFRNRSSPNDFSCPELFTSVITAIIEHSIKIDDVRDTKSCQPLLNKNYVYRAIVTNLIDYNLEDEKNFLSKTCLFDAFTDGLRSRSVITNFGTTFIDILEQGIYRSPVLVRELKVNEYSRILSHLFEVNVGNDDVLRFSTLSAIIKTIELAVAYVQIDCDLITYLPQLMTFARNANMENRRADVIKLFYLFVSQLTIDYHDSMCKALQEQIPIIINFYKHPMKTDIKEIFFHSIYLALLALYPHLIDSSFELQFVPKTQTWTSTLDMLQTIVTKEVKEYKSTPHIQRKSSNQQWFIKMAACVTYLKLWTRMEMLDNSKASPESRKKSKHSDKIEQILGLVQVNNSDRVDVVWLAILTELICSYTMIVNATNISQILHTSIQLLQTLTNVHDFYYLRRYLSTLLYIEENLISTNCITSDYCGEVWAKLVQILKSNCATNLDVVEQQQLLLRDLIAYKKLSVEDCIALLESFINNAPLKRNECIETVQQMLMHAESIGLNKNVDIVERIIEWLYGEDEKVRMQHMLQNAALIDEILVANTAAIAVINFLHENPLMPSSTVEKSETNNHQFYSILYKRNRKFICLQDCEHTMKLFVTSNKLCENENRKTCLFQNNYNLLMRTLNFEPTAEMTIRNILKDLSSLEKIGLVMKAFIEQGIFNSDNFMQCPLIKRIGLFLNHLKFQLKTIGCENFSDVVEIMQRLDTTINVFTSSTLLLHHLEIHSLEVLLDFVETALKRSETCNTNCELDDWRCVTFLCLRVLSKLSGSSVYYDQTFVNITNYEISFPTEANLLFELIEIFCQQEVARIEIVDWFVNQLKSLFRNYYTNIEIVEKVITLLPAIFKYIRNFENSLQSMFIALASLLKIAYRKSYSVKMTVRIIECVRNIIQSNTEILYKSEFINICLTIAKFLTISSMDIQLATIRTITTFIHSDSTQMLLEEHHLELCKTLFSSFEWKNLPMETVDLEQNAIAITVQFLVTFFIFSVHCKENAMQELMHFCALRNIKEVDLYAFKQIGTYYNCSLSDLCKPFIGKLLHSWTKQHHPIIQFPYYLCGDNKDEFFSENITEIVTCLLIYGKLEDSKPLKKYVTKDLPKSITPIVNALLLPSESKCPETTKSEYEQHIKKLKENSNAMGLKLLTHGDLASLNWKTIFFVINHLKDEEHFQQMFGYSIDSFNSNWWNISFESIKRCLNFYINGNHYKIGQHLEGIIKDNPLQLFFILNELQKNCMDCIFVWEKIKYFYIYCTILDLITESIPKSHSNVKFLSEHSRFFVRDAIFFILNFVRKGKHLSTKKDGLLFLNTFLHKPEVITGCCVNVIASFLNDLCKSLVTIADESNSLEIEQISIEIITFLIVENKSRFIENIFLLDEFPAKDSYVELRECQSLPPIKDGDSKEASNVLKSFLHAKNRGVQGIKALRQYIPKHKLFLQNDKNFLYKLINRLILIVRNSESLELKNEAALCLGDIGSLKIKNASYFFHTENSIYKYESDISDANKYFHASLFREIDRIFLEFNSNTYQSVRIVVQQLANSVHGKSLLDTNSYFHIFSSNFQEQNYLDTVSSCSTIDWISILKSTEQCNSYNQWICDFVSNAYKNCNWIAFQELSLRNLSFADASLLPLVRLLISQNNEQLQNIFHMLDYFFEEFSKASKNTSNQRHTIFRDKRIIRKLLDVCECIRIYNNWTLALNLINVCEACNYCQAYFMTVMYLELCYVQSEVRSENKKQITENETLQNAALKAYQSIGCNDAVESFLNPYKSRIEFLNLRNDWPDILLETTSNETVDSDLYNSILKRNGILPFGNVTNNQKNVDYEICWRMCQWDAVVEGYAKVNNLNDMEQEFQKQHFSALKCLYNREENNTLAALSNARQCIVSILNEISIECLQSVYKYLTWLQLLQQIEDFCKAQFYSGANLKEIFQKWIVDSELEYGNFRYKEEILSHQIALFHTAGVRTNRKILEIYKVDPIETCLLNCVNICKKAGEINLAKRNIAKLRNMKTINNKLIKINMLLEDANICFNTGKPEITKSILDYTLASEELHCLYTVKAIRMYGEYLLETNSQTFEYVVKKSFDVAVTFLDNFCKNKQQTLNEYAGFIDAEKFDHFEIENRKKIYQTIAKYADREYMQFNSHINSEEYQMKHKIIQQSREAADAVSQQNKDRDKNVGATLLKKNAVLDEREMKLFQTKCIQNLCIAVKNYIKFCSIDDTASESTIYRIIAVWFSNQQNAELHSTIEEGITLIPSYKFVSALNQITGRLNSKNQLFLTTVKQILIQCVKEHPHQTLYKLFPLVFAFNDGTGNKTNNRVAIAKEIITKGKNEANANTIQQLEIMFPAMIDFANLDPGELIKLKTIALNEKMKKLRNLSSVHCPTISLPAVANQEYNIISIVRWSPTVSLVGGINAPKKLMCLCSDGIVRPQLLKGKDDLRQDAVMQQVFAIINKLLDNEPETAKHKLLLRTYNVVPLSMRSGILEWCENTIPIGFYLTKAHEKYHPHDFPIARCRKYAMQNLKSNITKRREIFDFICENLQPVMHIFLLERFLVPGIWFERRLAYTNSVATNSIVGFILGLGDRHTQNILIDEKTAELIHIDFGIAFEQGKIMPTPETVPFRLTRDIVAPMGVCKSDGIFKKSCEATMKILRRHRSVIITILEVLLYDPLYMWKVLKQKTSDPDEVDSCEEINLTAQRTLLCVQNKLEGKQAGILGTSEVGVQVQRLINEAQSAHNLSQLYPGWDPYL